MTKVDCLAPRLNRLFCLFVCSGFDLADRIGPIWGFGEEQELRNMYTRTRQPGLWFIAGGLAQCRINSKYLALQIKAIEEGLLPPATSGPGHGSS